MSSKISLIALGLGAYLAFAVASFPASVAHRWFAPDELALAAIDGTIWRGSAGFGGISGLAFSDLRWELNPAALVTGRLRLTAEIRVAGGFASSELTATPGRVQLANLRASADIAGLAPLFPIGDTTGQVSVQLDALDIVDGWPVTAVGEARIVDLAVEPILPTPGVSLVSLGNFNLQLVASDSPGIVGVVSDAGGPLVVSGRIELLPDRSYVLDALVTPRADASELIVNALEFMDQAGPNASGQYRFFFRSTP